MGISVPMDIGSHINATKGGVAAVASTGATHNGTGFDRTNYGSAVLAVNIGAATGAPSSFTVDAKVQHSDSSGSGYADFSPNTGSAAIVQQTAAGWAAVNVNLLGAKKYVRVVVTTTITGGSTPTVPVGATLIVGGAVNEPA